MNYFNKALSQFSTSMYVLSTDLPMENTLMGSKSQPAILCYLYDFHFGCFLYPLPGFQYDRCGEHSFSPKRVSGHIHGSLPVKSITGGSRRSKASQRSYL